MRFAIVGRRASRFGDPPHRIAYVIGELGKGGAEYQLYELLRHLDRRRFTPRVFVLAPGGWWVDPIRALGVPVEEIPRRGPADVRRLARLRVALRRFAPHVVHTILWSGNSYGRLADRKSTRLNSSHVAISYAVFCLKKKKKIYANITIPDINSTT